MSANNLNDLSTSLDSAILELLGPLRTSKKLDRGCLARVTALIDSIGNCLGSEPEVAKGLVGKLWFIFTGMLSEAEHARTNREEIEMAAWDVQERLRKIFGPRFS